MTYFKLTMGLSKQWNKQTMNKGYGFALLKISVLVLQISDLQKIWYQAYFEPISCFNKNQLIL